MFNLKKIRISSGKKDKVSNKRTLFSLVHKGWKFIVTALVILNIITLSLHLFIVWKINNSNLFTIKSEQAVIYKTIDRDNLEKITNYYFEKEQLGEEVKQNGVSVFDPSI
jgi:uncharacterized protein YpmS